MIGDIPNVLNQLDHMIDSQGLFDRRKEFVLNVPLKDIRFPFILPNIPDDALHLDPQIVGPMFEKLSRERYQIRKFFNGRDHRCDQMENIVGYLIRDAPGPE